MKTPHFWYDSLTPIGVTSLGIQRGAGAGKFCSAWGSVQPLPPPIRKARDESIRLRAAQDILDRLRGMPARPVEPLPPVDTSRLSTEEMETLDRPFTRVLQTARQVFRCLEEGLGLDV